MEIKTNLEIEQQIKRSSFLENIKAIGPGIVTILTLIAAGDLVTASVSGGNYGYNLMWLFLASAVIRFVVLNMMGRYNVCNTKKQTILEGYRDVSKLFPWMIGIAGLVFGHLFNAFIIIGSGETLAAIFNVGSPFIWSVIVVLVSLFATGSNVYSKLETIMKILLAIMTIAFVGLAVYSTPDMGAMLKGTIGFGIPEGTGTLDIFVVALGLIGAVTGSIANFLYPYFVKDKGWNDSSYQKLQRNDILFGICAAVVITLAIWIVGAEILKPNGIEVNSLADISQALSIHLGYFGSLAFYLGAFGILYSSLIGVSNGFPKITIDCLQLIKTGRKEKYGEKLENDPLFKWLSLFILISPIVWSIPGLPGFVPMTIFANALAALFVPFFAIGLIILMNKSSHLGKYKANMAENIVLVLSTALTIWVTVQWVINLF